MKRIFAASFIALAACQAAESDRTTENAQRSGELGYPAKQPDGSPLTAAFCDTEQAREIYGNIKTCSMVACDQGDKASCQIAEAFATQHAPETDQPAVELPAPVDAYIHSERMPPDKAVKYSMTYDNCMNFGLAADGVNSEMLRCTVDEFERQDVRLNQIYQTKMGDLPKASADKLRERQRVWIKSMKRKCEEENKDVEGGSMWPLVMSSCRTFETIRRRMWLESFPT